MNSSTTNARSILVLLTIGGVWGSSFLFIKVLVDKIAPIQVVTGRAFFGMLAIAGFVALRRATLSLLGPGLLGTGFAYILFFWLIDNVGSVRASLVTHVGR